MNTTKDSTMMQQGPYIPKGRANKVTLSLHLKKYEDKIKHIRHYLENGTHYPDISLQDKKKDIKNFVIHV